MPPEAEYVIVGRVRKAQGIRGELLVEPLTDNPSEIFAAGRSVIAGDAKGDLLTEARAGSNEHGARELRIERSRPFKGGWLLVVDGVPDRNEAEKWRGRYLLERATDLVPPRENEVYLHDLIGLRVETSKRASVGTVLAYYELPTGLMLSVQTDDGEVMLPYRAEVIAHTDLEQRVITLQPDVDLVS